MNLSPSELQKQKELKFKFTHNWLFADFTYCKQIGIHWLVFSEQTLGMFCILCDKHGVQIEHNKSKTMRFCKLALEDHAASKQHHAAITAEMLSRVSAFQREYVNQVNSRDEVLSNVFQAYFLPKNEISNRKFISFLEFPYILDIQYFKHRSEYSVREIYLTIRQTIKEMILEQVREEGIYGFFADDATDIAVMEQMVTFVSYIDPLTSQWEVKFLFIEDVLDDPEAGGANAGVLLKVLLTKVEDSELKIENLMSLASDGASAKTGQRNGLAAKLKSMNSKIILFHSISHRLALSCVDSNDERSYVSVVETILRQLKFF